MSFGSQVDEYRKRYGMSKKVLAERIGIHPVYLSRIIAGKTNPPQAKIVERIIEVLHLSAEEAANLREKATYRVLYNKDNQPFIGQVNNSI